jgi:branched-chain amino acid aminotransferase
MIPVRKAEQSRLRAEEILHADFGRIVSDHMLVADYCEGRWQEPEIVPFGEFMISPTALGLHYGQTIFEGMKAFRMKDGRVSIFRMEKHYQRFRKSLERMCMAFLPREHFVDGIRQLIAVDEPWVPNSEGASLYIRPFMFATEARFGMKISDEYRFNIFTGPVGPYYTKPLRVKVERHFTRAAKGGTGAAKCGGNYGASFYPAMKAKEEGFDQVLWTDGDGHEFIEESGTMNIMFMIDDVLVTPSLTDTILDGVTRDSLVQIARDMGVKVQERKISYLELKAALQDGKKLEAFGAGTAAITAPIAVIQIDGMDYDVPPYSEESFCVRAAKRLTQIRTGEYPDTHGWNTALTA